MKKLTSILLSGIVLTTSSMAYQEKVEKENYKEKGFEFSVDYWVAIPDGNFQVDESSYGLKELGYDKAKDIGAKIMYKGLFDENLNVAFVYTPIKFDASKKADKSFTFKEFSVNQRENYDSTYDIKNYDLGFLYDIKPVKEITNDRLDVRGGFSLRYVDRSLEFSSENGSEYKKTDSTLKPMIDLEAEVEVLPIHQALTAEIILELQLYIWNNEYIHDFIDSLRVNYKHFFVETGYRVAKYKLNDSLNTKTSAQGGFVSLGVMF